MVPQKAEKKWKKNHRCPLGNGEVAPTNLLEESPGVEVHLSVEKCPTEDGDVVKQ